MLLILYGDVPLVQAETLTRLLEASSNGVAVLTEFLDDRRVYGRIVRNAAGQVDVLSNTKTPPLKSKRLMR